MILQDVIDTRRDILIEKKSENNRSPVVKELLVKSCIFRIYVNQPIKSTGTYSKQPCWTVQMYRWCSKYLIIRRYFLSISSCQISCSNSLLPFLMNMETVLQATIKRKKNEYLFHVFVWRFLHSRIISCRWSSHLNDLEQISFQSLRASYNSISQDAHNEIWKFFQKKLLRRLARSTLIVHWCQSFSFEREVMKKN